MKWSLLSDMYFRTFPQQEESSWGNTSSLFCKITVLERQNCLNVGTVIKPEKNEKWLNLHHSWAPTGRELMNKNASSTFSKTCAPTEHCLQELTWSGCGRKPKFIVLHYIPLLRTNKRINAPPFSDMQHSKENTKHTSFKREDAKFNVIRPLRKRKCWVHYWWNVPDESVLGLLISSRGQKSRDDIRGCRLTQKWNN